jgi:UDP-N-acetylglucosamine:LPS N-acetylglucosamine transferase
MQTHVFSFGGFLHSYWQLYFGYELFVTISCLVECSLLWQLATLSTSAPRSIRPMVVVLFLGEVATAALMIKFFFIIPIIVHIANALCLGLALTALTRKTSPEPFPTPP